MNFRTLRDAHLNTKKTVFFLVIGILFILSLHSLYVGAQADLSLLGGPILGEPIFDQVGILGDDTDETLSSLIWYDPSDTDTLFLAYTFPPDGPSGTEVILTGGGFTAENNSVSFGGTLIENITPSAGDELKFTVPSVSFGSHAIFVTNENGTSNTTFFNVLDLDKETPVITSVTPSSAKVGDIVTIIGSGFTPSSNVIYAGEMTFTNVPSVNGTTLTFVMQSLIPPDDLIITPEADEELLKSEFKGDIPNIEFEPLWIYVENEGGFSNDGFFWRKFEDIHDIMEMM